MFWEKELNAYLLINISVGGNIWQAAMSIYFAGRQPSKLFGLSHPCLGEHIVDSDPSCWGLRSPCLRLG